MTQNTTVKKCFVCCTSENMLMYLRGIYIFITVESQTLCPICQSLNLLYIPGPIVPGPIITVPGPIVPVPGPIITVPGLIITVPGLL